VLAAPLELTANVAVSVEVAWVVELVNAAPWLAKAVAPIATLVLAVTVSTLVEVATDPVPVSDKRIPIAGVIPAVTVFCTTDTVKESACDPRVPWTLIVAAFVESVLTLARPAVPFVTVSVNEEMAA
jgi:hypothetical protein